jgi:transposase
MIDATDAAALPLREQLQRFGMRQPGCRALVDAHYGVGGLTAVAVWSELGDCRRFSRSQQVVRHTGLDVTVDSPPAAAGRPAGQVDADARRPMPADPVPRRVCPRALPRLSQPTRVPPPC